MKRFFLKSFKEISISLLHLFFIFLAMHLVIYIHEWTHGTVAWTFGYKSHPFDVYYGKDWIFLSDINEAIDYQAIYRDQKSYVVGLIAIMPMFVDACLFMLGLSLIKGWKAFKNRFISLFIYWTTLIALADIYAYIPIRTFQKSEDIFNFCSSTNVSCVVVAILGSLFVLWGLFQFFLKVKDRAYFQMKIDSSWSRQTLLFLSLFLFFVYYGGIGFLQPNSTAYFLSMLSWALFPILFLTFNLVRRFAKLDCNSKWGSFQSLKELIEKFNTF